MRIDLHCHSTCSDGTDSPADLVAAASATGVHVVGLCDHDTMSGWESAAEAGRRHGVQIVPGVEISCERDGVSIHLLGLLLDPHHPELVAELGHARESRATRLRRMVDGLVAGGIPLSYAAVLAHVPDGATPGRPHIADALVAAGVVHSRGEAFARWLHDDSPYYVRHYAPDPARAVEIVRAAGGVPVLAHPFTRIRRRAVLADPLVEELAACGLAGIEADHPDHDEDDRRHAREQAQALGLLVTGGSDYHGDGKVARLAQDLTDPDVLAALEQQASGAPVVRS